MLRYFRFLIFAAAAYGQVYEFTGQITPAGRGSVSLYGATQPFTASTLTDDGGRFAFRKLDAGTYTLSVYLPGRGEARQTIEIGPGTADSRRRVHLSLALREGDFDPTTDRRRHAVSARQLTIPERAVRDYEDSQHDLEKRDVESAEKRLEHAVELAPQFENAWNTLGTIAYQTRRFTLAEQRFREALKQDPTAYEPLVNLGGVLVTLHKLDEALEVNVHAALTRPGDALAESQLGMTYFELGQFDNAVKHLERARKLDPAHFSHPQLYLAEIHLRRGEKAAAADVLEDFLLHHPDYPQADKVRENIGELRR
uniref:TPR repeat-containing protein n=1 Tax=Solibacter usitatus (strain Ellin6076) TaxID=234267 RepID=Q01ZA4_SOLUE